MLLLHTFYQAFAKRQIMPPNDIPIEYKYILPHFLQNVYIPQFFYQILIFIVYFLLNQL